jgi:hypothetical protein
VGERERETEREKEREREREKKSSREIKGGLLERLGECPVD